VLLLLLLLLQFLLREVLANTPLTKAGQKVTCQCGNLRDCPTVVAGSPLFAYCTSTQESVSTDAAAKPQM